jgi:hypothetical protein
MRLPEADVAIIDRAAGPSSNCSESGTADLSASVTLFGLLTRQLRSSKRRFWMVRFVAVGVLVT